MADQNYMPSSVARSDRKHFSSRIPWIAWLCHRKCVDDASAHRADKTRSHKTYIDTAGLGRASSCAVADDPVACSVLDRHGIYALSPLWPVVAVDDTIA